MYQSYQSLQGGLGRVPIASRVCAADAEFCEDRCVRNFLTWKQAYPERDACLNNEQRDKIIRVCELLYDQQITQEEAQASTGQLINDPCQMSCEDYVRKWASENPQDAACVGPQNMHLLVEVCMQVYTNQLDPSRARDVLAELVLAGCPPAPPAPVPQPPAPVQPPPVPEPVMVPEPVAPESVDVAMYTPQQPVAQPTRRSPLRTWGPVVGALLIVGGGIYLLR